MAQPLDASGEMVIINGKTLACPICGHGRFHHRKSLLNTRKATFFKIDWLNKEADNYVCDLCGYVTWFLKKKD